MPPINWEWVQEATSLWQTVWKPFYSFIHLLLSKLWKTASTSPKQLTGGQIDPKAKRRKAAFNFRIPSLHFPAAGGGRLVIYLFISPLTETSESRCCRVDTSTCIIYLHSLRPPHACAKTEHVSPHTPTQLALWVEAILCGHGTARNCVCLCAAERESASQSSAEEGNAATMRRFQFHSEFRRICSPCVSPLVKRDEVRWIDFSSPSACAALECLSFLRITFCSVAERFSALQVTC